MNPPEWNSKIKLLAETVTTITRPAVFDKVAVIVEPRELQVTNDLLKWMMWLLVPAGWKFVYFAGKNNIQTITDFVHSLKVDDVFEIKNLDKENLTINDYNLLLTSIDFWSSLPYENILIFQTDTVLLDNNLSVFLEYDYVGAPWNKNMKWLNNSTENVVGNGGLSLRRKSAMIKALELVPYNFINEDSYFAIRCRHLLKLPSPDLAKTFSVETVFFENPKGYHKCWAYIGNDIHKVYTRIDNIIKTDLKKTK